MADRKENISLWEPFFDTTMEMFRFRHETLHCRSEARWLLAHCRKEMSPAARKHIRYYGLLRKLHRLFDEDAGDSSEANVIREEMLDLWTPMTPEDQERVRALSVKMKREARGDA